MHTNDEPMLLRRFDFSCRDCRRDKPEWYMVKDEVWELAWPPGHYHPNRGPTIARPDPDDYNEFLCIECLERRLGRMLSRRDFTDVQVNRSPRCGHHADRLTREP
jgi:hypothetical protein